MASVAPASPARTRYDAQLDAEIGKAVGRIRANDLFAGGLAAAVLTLAFTVGMVLLDRWLVLAMPVRQAALAGFLILLAAVGYLGVVRPLRRAVNPRFAARRVEGTVADSKNAVINWVDLKDRELAPTVRNAVGQKAAGNLAAADVAKATEARPVVWLGAAAGLLAATLAVLFVALKPAPFTSLVKRTFNPFVAREIATRTTLELTEPAGGDAEVTAGESMTVAVDVGGSVPDAGGPNRLRLQVWHTDAAAEVDELPLEPGPGNDWRLTIPPSVIQNGFSFRVVGGDARTADHRVTVRSRPLVTGFEARYVSPKYTRIPVETGREPKLEGYRGTKVTLLARTNRPLKRGWMQLESRPDPIPATITGDNRDTLQFDLTLSEPGSYRLGFTSAADEVSEPTPPYPVKVLSDQPPTLSITAPAGDETTLPANGTLAIDGEVADDFGLAAVTLRMRTVTPIGLTLQPKPYRGGKSFRRTDGTSPTRLADAADSQTGYKETVELAALKQANGQPLPPATDLVIEYWLEATDTCTEPRPNVGTSAKKRLRLAPAVTDAPKKQDLDRQAQARKADQQRHEQAQDKQLDAEKRDPKQLRPDGDKPPEGQPQQGEPGQGGNQPDDKQKPENGKQGGEPKAGGDPKASPDPKASDPAGKPSPEPKAGDPTKPDPDQTATQPKAGDEPKSAANQKPDDTKGGQPSASKGQPSPDQKKLDEQADKVKQALREQGGDESPETAPPPQPAGEQKPQTGGSGDADKQRKQEMQKAIDDMNGSDPAKQQTARDKLDQMVGKEERQRIEKLQQNLKSDDPEKRKQAAKELGELDRETGTSGAGVRGDRKEDVERLSREAEELNSPDENTKRRAEDRADREYGRQGRDQLQKAGEKLKSPEPAKQEEGKKDIDELVKKKKKPKEQPSGGEGKPKDGQPSPGDQVRQQANDLTSTDPGKRAAAEKALDDKMGEPARKDLQKKLGSKDDKQQEAGRQQVEEMAKQAGDAGNPSGDKKSDKGSEQTKPTKEEVDRAAETARDLTSNDPAKREAAEKKLDAQMGKEKREQLQKQLNDLKPGTPNQQDEAAKNLEQMAKDEAAKAGQPSPTPEQAKELADAARDLNSTDPGKKRAAEDKMDKAVGKPMREKLQQDQAAKQPDPKATHDATEQAMRQPKADNSDPAAEQKAKELAETAKDLNSPDQGRKEAAEKKLDEQIGKPAREKLQQELKDLQSGDKQTREAAEQRLKEAMEQLRGKLDPKQPWQPGGGGTSDPDPGKEFTDDPANRLKTAELQLKTFEKNKANKGLLDKLGYTEAEYERFLAEYAKRVEQMRSEAVKPPADAPKSPAGPPTLRVAGGSSKPLDKKGDGATTGGAAAGKPAAGYTDAQKRFAAQAAKGKPAEAPKKP